MSIINRITLVIVLFLIPLGAYAQENKAALQVQTNATITSNGQEAITGTILNTNLINIILSMGTLLDANTWGPIQTFSLAPIISPCTGYIYGNGSSAISCSATIPATNISGSVASTTPAANLTGTTLAANVVTSSLTTLGTIATGVWNGTTIAVGFGGTGTNTASGTALDNISGFAGTGFLIRTGAGAYTFQSATNSITLAQQANLTANTFEANLTNAGAIPTAAPILAYPPQGRLTLTSGVPILQTGVSAATSVIYTPYKGNVEPLWNGGAFIPTACTEISNVLANSATGNAGPAAAIAATPYDLFIWNNAGACTLTRGPAWTNSTTRSAGTALARVNGILVNNVNITNGPNSSFGTYVGTIYTDAGGGTVSYTFAGQGSGGVALFLDVWNMYNRVLTTAIDYDTGTSYSYTTATIREARGSTGNQIIYVSGLPEEAGAINISRSLEALAVNGATGTFGTGATGTFANHPSTCYSNSGTNVMKCDQSLSAFHIPFVGATTIFSNEDGDGANANLFDVNSNDFFEITFNM